MGDRPRHHRLPTVNAGSRRDGGARTGAGVCAPNHPGGQVPGQGARAGRGDPLRTVAEADSTHRFKSVTGWREVGCEAWQAAGIAPPIEPLQPDRAPPPWEMAACPHVSFSLSIGAPRQEKRLG